MWYLVELISRNHVEQFLKFANELQKPSPDPIEMSEGSTVFEIDLSNAEKDHLNLEIPSAKLYPSSKFTS